MEHSGEIISLVVAFSWTITALFANEASIRLGAMVVNVIRMVLATLFLALILWVTVGTPYPLYADGSAWFYLSLSAIIGYVFGDFCLFNSYVVIGARFGQLFMTLAPPISAIAGWLLLGEVMSWRSWLAMFVTISGIAISILSKGEGTKLKFDLPLKGVLLGIGAGLGQGVGLVLSKIGIEHYADALPADAPDTMSSILPFASTMIRAIIGGAGFIIWMAIQKDLSKLRDALKERKGITYASLTTIFGPVIGVSLSLAAVQYTDTGIASTLMALTPVLIIAPYAIIYKQRVKAKEILGVILAMAGVAMFFL